MKVPEQLPDSLPLLENECEGLPFFVKNWTQMYMIVIGALLLYIGLFYAMMQYFD